MLILGNISGNHICQLVYYDIQLTKMNNYRNEEKYAPSERL